MADAPSNATFIDRYPEFFGADDALITLVIADAAAETNADVFQSDELTNRAVLLRAAILLSEHPNARKLAQSDEGKPSRWERQLRKLQRAATMGKRVF